MYFYLTIGAHKYLIRMAVRELQFLRDALFERTITLFPDLLVI